MAIVTYFIDEYLFYVHCRRVCHSPALPTSTVIDRKTVTNNIIDGRLLSPI